MKSEKVSVGSMCGCGERLWRVSVSGSKFIWGASECDELVGDGGE